MGDEEPKKEETIETPSEPLAPAPATPPAVEAAKDVAEEKTVIPPPPPPQEKEKVDDSKALAIVENVPESTGEKSSGGSNDRDIALARLATEKRVAFVAAWEESEKSKAENKAQKNLSAIDTWENSKKATVEAKLRKTEEKLEKKKQEYIEKMKNQIALIHREADEKRAVVQAKRGEDLLKAEELAAKHRATGSTPKKIGCFGS